MTGGGEFESTRWSRIRAGDYEYLVRRFWKPVWRFLAARLPPGEDAQDATQDIFLAFLQRNLLERTHGTFRSFLFHFARLFLIDRYRHARTRRKRWGERVPLEAVSDELEGGASRPQDALDREWFLSLLSEARRKLKAHLRDRGREEDYQAFHLYYFGGDASRPLSHAEIASRLGSTASRVRTNVFRAKRIFSGILEGAIREYAADEADFQEEVARLEGFLEGPRGGSDPAT